MTSKLAEKFPKFNTFAMVCSTLYFVFFVAFLGCLTSGQCSSDGIYGVKLMKIIALIPPMIYFGFLLFDAIKNNTINASRFQLGMLLTYFFLVFIFLCSDLANNTEAAKNINTICLFILPIFIILSFYNTYESWQQRQTPKHIIYLSLTLSVLYYCLFYFSLQYGGSVFGEFGDKSVNGVLITVGILLIFQFGYIAAGLGKKDNRDVLYNKITKFF